MRILIADDAPDARMLLSRILGKWGHDVVVAENGCQAWEILRREPIRLLISDWMMPGIDGMQLCRQIRDHGFPDYVYVILLTGRDAQSDIMAAIEAGADDYLTKPFDRDDLRVRVRTAQRVLDIEPGSRGLRASPERGRRRTEGQ